MGTTFNKAIVAAVLPYLVAVLNNVFGTEFIVTDALEATVMAVVNGFLVWLIPNKGTRYVADK